MTFDTLRGAVRPQYYWVVGLSQGRAIVLGPYKDEDAANSRGIERLEGDFEVIALPTRNESRATRMLKSKRLDDGSTLSEALKRIGHQKKEVEDTL